MTQRLSPAWSPDKLVDDTGNEHYGYAKINVLLDTRYLAEWYEGTFALFEPGAWKAFDIGSVVSVTSNNYQIPLPELEMHVYEIHVLENKTGELRVRTAGKPTR